MFGIKRHVFTGAILACLAIGVGAQVGTTDGMAAAADGATSSDTSNAPINVTSLVGTWSSGSQAVETGLGFFNPVTRDFTLPKNTGVSYSFTEDGFFETAKYRFTSNAKKNRCFQASLVWQHGKYFVHTNGSITLEPFGADGFIQVMDPCAAETTQSFHYDEFELIPNWYNYLDGNPGFLSDQASAYALQLFQFDGQKMPLMFLKYRPANMLPIQQLYMKVLNS